MSFDYSSLAELQTELSPMLEDDSTCKATRLVIKYHHGKGEMAVRATDGVVSLKFLAKEHKAMNCESLLCTALAQMAGLSAEDIAQQVTERETILQGGIASNHIATKKKKAKKSSSNKS